MEDYVGKGAGKLGFGLMRLPRNEDGAIDIEQVCTMVDMFMDAGFTYFDTAWAYPGSEEAIKKALVERYPRDSYTLATKLAAWIKCETKEEAEAQFYTSLERTGAGYFDYYLLHNLGNPRTECFDKFDLWDFVQEKKKEGLIKHVGFSFHSSPEELEEILIAHPEVEFVQLQINYADWEDPSVCARANYEMVMKYGKQLVIMEPVKGGSLASLPEPVAAVFKAAEPESSMASWALRFAASLPGLIAVLSGMSNIEQMEDNLKAMRGFTGLTDEQVATIEAAREALAKIPMVPCTGCNYCSKVCPMDIGISLSFRAVNDLLVFGNLKEALRRESIVAGMHGKKRANECLKCGACEEVCPQHINIREELERVVKLLIDRE